MSKHFYFSFCLIKASLLNKLLKITFIIPVKKMCNDLASVKSIRQLKYPKELIEILIVEGLNISKQRNLAIAKASGDVLYFVDDDSEITSRALEYVCQTFEDYPLIDGVGGPCIEKHTNNSFFQDCLHLAFSSTFGAGPTKARYAPQGLIRRASEKELITCNLALKKEAFAKTQGFDERLYGNEENELVKRLEKSKGSILYHPLLIIRRSPRDSLAELAVQMFRYGAGRSKHFRIKKDAQNFMMLLPISFTVYLLIVLTLPYLTSLDQPFYYKISLMPLLAYLLLSCLTSFLYAFANAKKIIPTFFVLNILFPAMHLFYAIGSIYGLFAKISVVNEKTGCNLIKVNSI